MRKDLTRSGSVRDVVKSGRDSGTIIETTESLPPSSTNATSVSAGWLRQGAYLLSYVWGFAIFLALGTKGCDWISEPSSAKVALGLASVVVSIFGAAVLISQIVRKIIETGRRRRHVR